MNNDNTIEKRAGFTPGPRIVSLKGLTHEEAKRVASAPALYEQCKLFERALMGLQMQGETGVDEELEKLREVLAKADGGAEA